MDKTVEKYLKALEKIYSDINGGFQPSISKIAATLKISRSLSTTLRELDILENKGGNASSAVWVWTAGRRPDEEMAKLAASHASRAMNNSLNKNGLKTDRHLEVLANILNNAHSPTNDTLARC